MRVTVKDVYQWSLVYITSEQQETANVEIINIDGKEIDVYKFAVIDESQSVTESRLEAIEIKFNNLKCLVSKGIVRVNKVKRVKSFNEFPSIKEGIFTHEVAANRYKYPVKEIDIYVVGIRGYRGNSNNWEAYFKNLIKIARKRLNFLNQEIICGE